MQNDTPLNILVSYAYCGAKKEFLDALLAASKAGKANLMLDSGAFTAHNSKSEFRHVNLDQYIDFCKAYGNLFEKYVMLDVLQNEEATKSNYTKMLQCGLNPMFVLTAYDTDFEFMRKAVERNPDICVAVAGKKNDWALKRFQDAFRESQQKARIHALGFVKYPIMLQLPIASCDSASWNLGPSKYGQLVYFEKGMKNADYKDFIYGRKKMPDTLRNVLEFCKVSPSMFKKLEYHRGKAPIGLMLSIVANHQMQRYCYRRGLRFFLAINSLRNLRQITYVIENFNNLNYIDFKKI